MRSAWIALVPALCLTPALWAFDEPPGQPARTPEAEYNELQKQFNDEIGRLMTASRDANTAEARARMVKDELALLDRYCKQFLKLAEAHPKDRAGVNALLWITRYNQGGPIGQKAFDILVRDHLEDRMVISQLKQTALMGNAHAEGMFRAIKAKSKDHELLGWANFGLANSLKQKKEATTSEPEAKRYGHEAEELFQNVIDHFGDVSGPRAGMEPAVMAKRNLFELRHLSIGSEAPEIEGEAIDGKPFKLSDYRGKVVVLDFWGHW